MTKDNAETDAVAPGSAGLLSGAASDPLIDTEQSGHGLSLLPCPFCGGPAVNVAFQYVTCGAAWHQECTGHKIRCSVEEWNTRANTNTRKVSESTQALKRRLASYEQDERVANHAQCMYWLGQWRMLAGDAIAALSDPARPETGVRAEVFDEAWYGYKNLREYQDQLDFDGIMVGVSRQALESVLDYCAAALSTDEAGGVQPIPARVYFNREHDNFYSFDKKGMGEQFYLKWVSRWTEFPDQDAPTPPRDGGVQKEGSTCIEGSVANESAPLSLALQEIVDLQDRMISGEGKFMRAITIARKALSDKPATALGIAK